MKILLKIIIVILIIVILILVVTLLFLRFWPSVGATPDKAHQREYAKSDLFYDKQFHNENEIQLMAGKQDEASDRRFPSEMIKAETPTFSEHGNKGEITFTWLVPVHWGTFCLCNHSWDEPVIRSTAEAKAQGQNIATPRIGQTVNYNDIESYNERWWESID